MVAISELFSQIGSANFKLVIQHANVECSGSLFRVIRSLISEHVIAERRFSEVRTFAKHGLSVILSHTNRSELRPSRESNRWKFETSKSVSPPDHPLP